MPIDTSGLQMVKEGMDGLYISRLVLRDSMIEQHGPAMGTGQ